MILDTDGRQLSTIIYKGRMAGHTEGRVRVAFMGHTVEGMEGRVRVVMDRVDMDQVDMGVTAVDTDIINKKGKHE